MLLPGAAKLHPRYVIFVRILQGLVEVRIAFDFINYYFLTKLNFVQKRKNIEFLFVELFDCKNLICLSIYAYNMPIESYLKGLLTDNIYIDSLLYLIGLYRQNYLNPITISRY